jgi:hypothetical protein
MLSKATGLWVVGLVTLVPYGTYYLFAHATRDQYALLITAVLFWIFGYWSVVGPLLAAVKVRRVFRTIERASSRDELEKALRSEEAREVAIELIASEHGIPRFLAARVFQLLVNGLSAASAAQSALGSTTDGRSSDR